MPFNGSGTFQRLYSWVTDAANALKISSPRMDQEMDGLAVALSNCMTRDGQSPALVDIPLGGKKIVNLANGVLATDAATVGQIPIVAPVRSVVSAAAGNQQNLGTAVTRVAFANLLYDSLGEFNVTSNRFTASNAGYYLVNAVVIMMNSVGAGPNFLNVYKNGTLLFNVSYGMGANVTTPVPITCAVFLNPTDFIEIYAKFAFGTANQLQPAAPNAGFSQLSVCRVG